jgi:hypothetical protein
VLACAPHYVTPERPVPAEPELEAHMGPAIKEAIEGTEFEHSQLGQIFVVAPDWRIEREQGVAIGRSKFVDMLTRDTDGTCSIVHFSVMQELVDGKYTDVYRAEIDGGREPLQCTQFH